MGYVITRLINGSINFMRESHGDDCFTDDIAHAIIFETVAELKPTILKGESFYPIKQDEEGNIIGILTEYENRAIEIKRS